MRDSWLYKREGGGEGDTSVLKIPTQCLKVEGLLKIDSLAAILGLGLFHL